MTEIELEYAFKIVPTFETYKLETQSGLLPLFFQISSVVGQRHK